MCRHLSRRTSVLGVLLLVIGSCSGDTPTQPSPACSFSLGAASATVAAGGGTGSVTLTTAAGCAWSVTGAGAWLTVTSPTSGSGPATVTYSAAANPDPQARSSALVIGGLSYMVSQPGRPPSVCTYEISQERADVGKEAGTGTLNVRAPGDCTWTATSSESWITINGANTGSGDGTVAYAFTRNTAIDERTAAIRVADRTLTVRQLGDIGQCEYSVVPVAVSACMPAGTLTATITTQASCPWTVASDSSWLTPQSATSGTGSAPVTFVFSDNYDAPRSGVVQVRWPTPTAGQNVHFAQAGCLYAVSQSSINVASGGGNFSFNVLQQSDPNTCGGATQDRCLWSAVSEVPWVTVTGSMPRVGDNSVSFTVAANPGTGSRVGRITVRDKVVTITQTGR